MLPRPSDGTKDHTIFLFTPVDDAGGAVVRAGSILRVQHYRSGQILHTNLQGPPDRTTETTTTLTLASKVPASLGVGDRDGAAGPTVPSWFATVIS